MDRLPKVELHVHLDGACDIQLLNKMCRADGLDEDLFHYDDVDKFREVVSLTKPQESLEDFLKPFQNISFILSTANNLKEQSIDLCRLQSESNVVYTEVRYCPHLFTSPEREGLSAEQSLLAILDGLDEGQKKYKIKVRSILSFLREFPEWSSEVADLAIKYKSRGVVGVDIAGNELQPMAQEHIDAFQKSFDNGLHVTVHAAESGPPSNVTEAIEKLHATRIGHGYRVLEDQSVYELAKQKNVHFETCLTSSIYTNSSNYEKHAIKVFATEDVNFGLNTDDPCIIDTTLSKEFQFAQSQIHLTEEQIIKSIYNAARSCFLPEDEKQLLIKEIDKKMKTMKQNNGAEY